MPVTTRFLDTALGYPFTGSRASLAPPSSDYVDARVLAAGVSETHAVPTDAEFVLLSATGDFFAKFGTSSGLTATVPSADVTDGSAGVLNPTARMIRGITHIALVAASDCIVTLEFYKA